jgi:hypothetical protein
MTPAAYRPIIVRLPLDDPFGARQVPRRRTPAERYDGTSATVTSRAASARWNDGSAA